MENENKLLVDIPKAFHSYHLEGPFQKCIECERNLLEDNCEYVIEKAIRNYPEYKSTDVIFDYAICMDCAERIHNDLSKESRESIMKYFSENLDMNSRANALSESGGNIDQMISKCMITQMPDRLAEEYQIFAHCKGNKVNLTNPPYMLSGEVLNELSELLSQKTRDDLGGFFDKHFSPDPTLFDKTPRLILI